MFLRVMMALASALCSVGAASADLKITTQVDISGLPEQAASAAFGLAGDSFPETITTYYQGGFARCEVAGGLVTIFDGPAGKVYTLDPASKTFYVRPTKDAASPGVMLLGRFDTASLETNLRLEKTEEIPGDDQSIAGLATHKYLLSGTIGAKPRQSGGHFGGGHMGHHGFGGGPFPGGGGYGGGGMLGGDYPGGDYPGGDYPGGGMPGGSEGGYYLGNPPPAIQFTGEVWLADRLRLPDDKKANALAIVAPDVFFVGPLIKPLADNLTKMKQIPLDLKLTISSGLQGTDDYRQIVVSAQTESVDESALPADLFAVPAGFQQTVAPRTTAIVPASTQAGGGQPSN